MAKLNEKSFALASAAVTFIVDIVGYIWHGLLQQPSVMNILYPGFWTDYTLMFLGLIGTVAGAYILGYIFALAYNKGEKR
jgi:hypothetical protein